MATISIRLKDPTTDFYSQFQALRERNKHLPGKHDQSTHGNRYGSSLEPVTEKDRVLVDYMKQVASWAEDSYEVQILKNGRRFNPQALPKGYRRGTPKQCYANAYRLVDSDPDLTYVEGLALPDFVDIPIAHAWAVDKNGNVIDNTWKTPGVSYIGIPFTTDFLHEVASETGVYGIFGYESRHILRDGVPSRAIRKKGGPGSGFYGHAGRPGEVGGSQAEAVNMAGTLTYSKVPPNDNTAVFLIDIDGNWIWAGSSVKRHTQLYALYVSEHASMFDAKTIKDAEDILEADVEEDWKFEDAVMEQANLISVENVIMVRDGKPSKEFIMKVSRHSPISVLNKAVKRLQRLVAAGNLMPEDYDYFYIVRGNYHLINPSDLELITGFTPIAGTRISDYSEEVHFKEVVEKQLPIDDDSKKRLIEVRRNIFYEDVDRLAEQLYTGDISLGQWEETMRRYVRELHTSTAAIGKGGWGEMTWKDWGRLGTPMREQYRYLHGFAEYIADNRENISLARIKARAHMYGNAAGHSAYLIEAGAEIASQLPWLPKDGSTECLVGCKCQWDLTVVGNSGNMKNVKAVWRLNPAEHCDDCVDRNGYIHMLRVAKDVPVPNKIGGY